MPDNIFELIVACANVVTPLSFKVYKIPSERMALSPRSIILSLPKFTCEPEPGSQLSQLLMTESALLKLVQILEAMEF